MRTRMVRDEMVSITMSILFEFPGYFEKSSFYNFVCNKRSI